MEKISFNREQFLALMKLWTEKVMHKMSSKNIRAEEYANENWWPDGILCKMIISDEGLKKKKYTKRL